MSIWTSNCIILKSTSYICCRYTCKVYSQFKPLGRGEGAQQMFLLGGLAPRSNPLPFYTPFFMKKVPLFYTLFRTLHPSLNFIDITLSLFLPWRHLGNYESPPSCALSRNTQAAYFNYWGKYKDLLNIYNGKHISCLIHVVLSVTLGGQTSGWKKKQGFKWNFK